MRTLLQAAAAQAKAPRTASQMSIETSQRAAAVAVRPHIASARQAQLSCGAGAVTARERSALQRASLDYSQDSMDIDLN